MRRAMLPLLAAFVVAIAGCSASGSAPAAMPGGVSRSPSAAASPTATAGSGSPRPHRHRHAPAAHRTAAAAPGPTFHWSSASVTAAQLGRSWRPGCPVGPTSLRALSLTFWGFDQQPHQGTLIANAAVVPAYVAAFRTLYRERFPIRRMQPVAAYGGSDNRSMNADNTSSFNCRYAVSDGPKSWSMHAYGEAVDIDPLENPYRLDGKVLPRRGAPYLDRSDVRPGMIVAGSAPVRAFASLGWGWGGYWGSSPDYQHFSVNGR